MRKLFFTYILFFAGAIITRAQDPHFSQFFMSPQLINPSSAGAGIGAWRIMGNLRQQWSNAGTSFYTSSLSGDTRVRIFRESENFIGVGGQILSDRSLEGAFQSVHAAASAAYHIRLNEQSRIGFGMQGMYSKRRLDYSALRFGEQFTSGGFDVALPSGENKPADMRAFLSVSGGVQYTYMSDRFSMDLGVAAFHLNRPQQSLLNDPAQLLAVRHVAHGSFDYRTESDWLVNMNMVYQVQSGTRNIAAGASVGRNISFTEIPVIVNAGVWYRYADAVYPFIGLQWDRLQIGLSYDVNVSKQINGPAHPRSMELSLIIKDVLPEGGYIHCPWK